MLSGFLITRLLLREVARTGTISLPRFWARRARRLLPASCVVVVATSSPSQCDAVADRPTTAGNRRRWRPAGSSSTSSSPRRLGDYFASQLGPHTVAAAALLVVGGRGAVLPVLAADAAGACIAAHAATAGLVTVTMIIVAVASFATCLWMTRTHPTGAFYLLPARMWELAIGGLVAVAGPAWRLVSPTARAIAGWIGVAGVATAVLTFDELRRLSRLGSAAARHRHRPDRRLRWQRTRPGSHRPRSCVIESLQWIGRRSYAIYLWHWPALVLAEAKWGPLSLAQRFVAIGVAVVLAAVSLRGARGPGPPLDVGCVPAQSGPRARRRVVCRDRG